MAIIGHGYGSEWQLLRMMGRHRHRFDKAVTEAIGRPGEAMDWADFLLEPSAPWPDKEHLGLDFIEDQGIQAAWRDFWPQGRGIHNWDAVGWVGPDRELVLLEAKAHLGEIRSSCGARERSGLPTIRRALAWTQESLGIADSPDWLTDCYQYANRLAVLAFLQDQGIPAHLLFLYFTGDKPSPNRNCPSDEQGWSEALSRQDELLGLPKKHTLKERVHQLFLPVS